MIESGCGDMVVRTIPQIAHRMKRLLNERNKSISFVVLRLLQEIIVCDEKAADAFVPHLRILLPALLPMLSGKRKEWSNGVCSAQEMVQETLELFETYGSDVGVGDEIRRVFPAYSGFTQHQKRESKGGVLVFSSGGRSI